MSLRRTRSADPAVHAAIGAVRDPELGRTLADLGMIDDITVRGDELKVTVALTTAGCPMRSRLADDITAAAHSVSAARVDVAFTTMSDQRRAAIAADVHGRSHGPIAREVYAIASGKGGVGKSSVAANLAVALARSGKSVGLIDADVWGYSVPQLFGVSHRPITMNATMLPVRAHGVALMSLGFFLDSADQPVVWRGPMLHKALTQFVHDVHWSDLDVLVLDLPPGTGDVTLSVLELLPEAALVLITTPQRAASGVASRVGAMAREARMPLVGVVENMSELVCAHCQATTPVFGSGGGTELADQLGTRLLGRVPLDVELRKSGDAGTPVVTANPQSPAAEELIRVAAALSMPRRSLVGRDLGLAAAPVGSRT